MSGEELVAILLAARERIQKAENWCTTDYAQDAAGNSVDPLSPRAVSWCVKGAIFAEGGGDVVIEVLDSVLDLEADSINDDGDHDQVLDALDEAVARLTAVDLDELEADIQHAYRRVER